MENNLTVNEQWRIKKACEKIEECSKAKTIDLQELKESVDTIRSIYYDAQLREGLI